MLLLVAQQGALVHSAWHAGADAHAAPPVSVHDGHGHEANGPETPAGHDPHDEGQRNLCAFDLAFGQVLGGVHGACAPQIAVNLVTSSTAYPFTPRLRSEAVPAISRGPPFFSEYRR